MLFFQYKPCSLPRGLPLQQLGYTNGGAFLNTICESVLYMDTHTRTEPKLRLLRPLVRCFSLIPLSDYSSFAFIGDWHCWGHPIKGSTFFARSRRPRVRFEYRLLRWVFRSECITQRRPFSGKVPRLLHLQEDLRVRV